MLQLTPVYNYKLATMKAHSYACAEAHEVFALLLWHDQVSTGNNEARFATFICYRQDSDSDYPGTSGIAGEPSRIVRKKNR